MDMHTHTDTLSLIQQQCWSFSIFAPKERTNQLESHPISCYDTHKIRSSSRSSSITKYNKKTAPEKKELEIWWKPFCVSWYSCSGNMPYKCKQMKWKKPFFNECWKWKHSSTCTLTQWVDKLEKWSGKKEDEITWTAETKEINCPCSTHH